MPVTTVNATMPLSMVVGKVCIYGVNGVQRGFRMAPFADFAENIGIDAATGVAATTSTSPLYHYVVSIDITDPGENFYAAPTVSVAGVTGALATVGGNQLRSISFLGTAKTHTVSPAVSFSGGQAYGASGLGLLTGGIVSIDMYSQGAPVDVAGSNVAFVPAANITIVRTAAARSNVTPNASGSTKGNVSGIVLTDNGVYSWDNNNTIASGARPMGATVAGATLNPRFKGSVSSAVVVQGGTGYTTPPSLFFQSKGELLLGGGADGYAEVSGGVVSSVVVTQPGAGFDGRVDLKFVNDSAYAVASIAPRFAGKYLCTYRWIDQSPDSVGGPVNGDIADPLEVDCGNGASAINWSTPTTAPSRNWTCKKELWRTTSNQGTVLYRVAQAEILANYTDTLTDDELLDQNRADYAELPFFFADGSPSATRFGVPPEDKAVLCMYQDRAWYAVDTSGTEANLIYFSEPDEPESVPDINQLIIQQTDRDVDVISGLIPLDSSLYVAQKRHLHRLTVGNSPLVDSSVVQVAKRGVLTNRCWDSDSTTVYAVDAFGMYSFNGSAVMPLSDAIATYWQQGIIDLEKAKWFSVKYDPDFSVVKFYYIPVGSGDTYPTMALCYSVLTSAWWQETYQDSVSSTAMLEFAGRQKVILGSSGSRILKANTGLTDNGTAVNYSIRTGNMFLDAKGQRLFRILYAPTDSSSILTLQLYFNNSQSARSNAITYSGGAGFSNTGSGDELDLAVNRSALGPSTGFAQNTFAGNANERSAGSDKTIAFGLSGTQSADAIKIHRVEIGGAE